MTRAIAAFVLVVVLVLAASPVHATTMVRVEPVSDTISVDQSFDVNIFATFSDAVLGWGLDLSVDDSVLEILGTPVIGPQWDAAFGADADGLAGLAFPVGITGADVLLATLTIRGIAPGVSVLQVGFTGGDLTEGFALDPTGFDSVTLTSGEVTVVPEPPLAWLVLLAVGLPVVSRATRRRALPW